MTALEELEITYSSKHSISLNIIRVLEMQMLCAIQFSPMHFTFMPFAQFSTYLQRVLI